ncbi:aspartate aminotransferase family protein [Amycolatopsis nigrescens]|uniref:aminotransferase family protein n=1 Tax=Amycolatopsis nigrescens TaxID=381445 RepID=UPI00037F608C|nr:aspartate aminotransferase family protein [Amycolatopsis nigrescens]
MTTTQHETKSPRTAGELEDLDRRHLIHPHQTGQNAERSVIVRGAGSSVWDANGTEFLDVSGAGNWACQVGYGRAELVAAATAQAERLAYFSGFFGFSNDKSVELAVRLAELAPENINRVFFTCGGSEGVETAIKLVRLFHHHRGEPDRTWIISRSLAYHGATYGSGTATGFPPMHDGIGPNLPHFEKVSPPTFFRSTELYGDADPTDFLLRELAETIERIGPGRIAAMIGEPVMGGGGVLVPPADYWPRVRELLSEHGILLIADEVVTAFGRTGAWFDSEQRGMAPDVIVTAKGLTSGYAPLGAVLMTDEIGETVAGEGAYFFHGHTYSGHPAACAVALANLDLLEQDGLLERSRLIGEWFRDALAPAAELPVVGDIRITGATAGIELADPVTGAPIMAGQVTTELRHAHAVILREYGPTVVLSPPLVITEHEVRRAAEAVIEVLSRLGNDGQVKTR